VDSKCRELNELQDSSHTERCRHQERISTLLEEVGHMGSVVGTKMDDSLGKIDPSSEISDEDFTKARILMSNLRYAGRGQATCSTKSKHIPFFQ